jgi:CRP/FNR family cyclic AMP-dependent transcriptional regulator
VRVTKKRRAELLGSVWLFEQCSKRELDVLQDAATEMQLDAGKILTKQGEIGRHFMVIVEGKVEVTRDGTQIAVLGPGSFFGEMSLLDGKPRTATATTLEPTHVLMLTTAAFNGVLATMLSVDRKLLTVLAARLRDIEARYVPANERGMGTDGRLDENASITGVI